MKITTVLATIALITAGCAGSTPPPEDATDTTTVEPSTPEELPPTMEEPPTPMAPPAPESAPPDATP
jgi:hypothetical protein